MYNNFLKRIAAVNSEDLSKLEEALIKLCDTVAYNGKSLLSYEPGKEDGIYILKCVYINGFIFDDDYLVKSSRNISDKELNISLHRNKKIIGKVTTSDAPHVKYTPKYVNKTKFVINIQQIADLKVMSPDELEFFTKIMEFVTASFRGTFPNAVIDPNFISIPGDEIYFKDGKAIATEYGNDLKDFITYINESCNAYLEDFMRNYLNERKYIHLETSISVPNILSRVYHKAASEYFNSEEFSIIKRDLGHLFKSNEIDIRDLTNYDSFIKDELKYSPEILDSIDGILRAFDEYLLSYPEIKQPNYDYLQALVNDDFIRIYIVKYIKIWFNKFIYKLTHDWNTTYYDNLNSFNKKYSFYDHFCKLIYAKTPDEYNEKIKNLKKDMNRFKNKTNIKDPEKLRILYELYKKLTKENDEVEEELSISELKEKIDNLRNSADPDIIMFEDLYNQIIDLEEEKNEAESEVEGKQLQKDYDTDEERNKYLMKVRKDLSEKYDAHYNTNTGKLESLQRDNPISTEDQNEFDAAVNAAMVEYDKRQKEEASKDQQKDQQEDSNTPKDDVTDTIYDMPLQEKNFKNFHSSAQKNINVLLDLKDRIEELRTNSHYYDEKQIRAILFDLINKAAIHVFIKQSLRNVLLVLNLSIAEMFNYLLGVLTIHIRIQEIFNDSDSFSEARKKINTELNRNRDLKFYFEYGTTDGNIINRQKTVKPFLNNETRILQKKFIQWAVDEEGLYFSPHKNELVNDSGLAISEEELQNLVQKFNTEFNTKLNLKNFNNIAIGDSFSPKPIVLDPGSSDLLRDVQYFKSNLKNNPKLQVLFGNWLEKKGYKLDIEKRIIRKKEVETYIISDANGRKVSDDEFDKLIAEFNKQYETKSLNDLNIMSANSIDDAINNLTKIYDYLNYQISQLGLK